MLVELDKVDVGKVPICIVLYHEQLTSKVLRYGTC